MVEKRDIGRGVKIRECCVTYYLNGPNNNLIVDWFLPSVILLIGTAEAPLVVDITQKKHKWLRDLGKIFLYLFIATYFLHTIDNSFKGALPHMKKTGFAQDIGDKKYK